LLWQGKDVKQYENLKTDAKKSGQTIPGFVKELIKKAITRKNAWKGY
jgi:hypothetical protein